jgi:hypothetical protein
MGKQVHEEKLIIIIRDELDLKVIDSGNALLSLNIIWNGLFV